MAFHAHLPQKHHSKFNVDKEFGNDIKLNICSSYFVDVLLISMLNHPNDYREIILDIFESAIIKHHIDPEIVDIINKPHKDTSWINKIGKTKQIKEICGEDNDLIEHQPIKIDKLEQTIEKKQAKNYFKGMEKYQLSTYYKGENNPNIPDIQINGPLQNTDGLLICPPRSYPLFVMGKRCDSIKEANSILKSTAHVLHSRYDDYMFVVKISRIPFSEDVENKIIDIRAFTVNQLMNYFVDKMNVHSNPFVFPFEYCLALFDMKGHEFDWMFVPRNKHQFDEWSHIKSNSSKLCDEKKTEHSYFPVFMYGPLETMILMNASYSLNNSKTEFKKQCVQAKNTNSIKENLLSSDLLKAAIRTIKN